jgi:hypothetical protein
MIWSTELLKIIVTQHVRLPQGDTSTLEKIIECCGELLKKYNNKHKSIEILPILVNVARWSESHLSQWSASATFDDISLALFAVVATNIKYECDTFRLFQSDMADFAVSHGMNNCIFTTEKLIAAEQTYLKNIDYHFRITENDVFSLLERYATKSSILQNIRDNAETSLRLYSAEFKEKLNQLFRQYDLTGLATEESDRQFVVDEMTLLEEEFVTLGLSPGSYAIRLHHIDTIQADLQVQKMNKIVALLNRCDDTKRDKLVTHLLCNSLLSNDERASLLRTLPPDRWANYLWNPQLIPGPAETAVALLSILPQADRSAADEQYLHPFIQTLPLLQTNKAKNKIDNDFADIWSSIYDDDSELSSEDENEPTGISSQSTNSTYFKALATYLSLYPSHDWLNIAKRLRVDQLSDAHWDILIEQLANLNPNQSIFTIISAIHPHADSELVRRINVFRSKLQSLHVPPERSLLETAIHTEIRPDQLSFLAQQPDLSWWTKMALALTQSKQKFRSFFALLPSTHLVPALNRLLELICKNRDPGQLAIILALLIDQSQESEDARALLKKATESICSNQILPECWFHLTTKESIALLSTIPTNTLFQVLESSPKPTIFSKLDTEIIFYLFKRCHETQHTKKPDEKAEVYRTLISCPTHLRDLKSLLHPKEFKALIRLLGSRHLAQLITQDADMRETLTCVKSLRTQVLNDFFKETLVDMRGLFVFLGSKANDPMDLLRSLSPDEKLILMRSINCHTPQAALFQISRLFQTEVTRRNPYLYGYQRVDASTRCIQLLELFADILYHELNVQLTHNRTEFEARSNLTAEDINQAHMNHVLERMRTFSRIDLQKFPGCSKGNIGAIIKMYHEFLSIRENSKNSSVSFYSRSNPALIIERVNTEDQPALSSYQKS